MPQAFTKQSLPISFSCVIYQGIQGLIDVCDEHLSAAEVYQRESSRGVQVFQETPSGQLEMDAVGRPMPHVAAQKQATGEAQYCDDIPIHKGNTSL